MDFLRPPTDNLYKFLAIGGLVSVIAAAVLWNKENTESFFRRHQLEKQLNDTLTEFHVKFGSEVCHDDLPGYVSAPPDEINPSFAVSLHLITDEEDRVQVYEHLLLHETQIRRLCATPNKEEDISFWAKWYKLTDAQIIAIRDSEKNWIADVNKAAQEFRPRMEGASQLALEIWMVEDGFVRIDATAKYMACGGLALMVIGFVLWYWKVQRHQDKLLLLELKKVNTSVPIVDVLTPLPAATKLPASADYKVSALTDPSPIREQVTNALPVKPR